MSYPHCPQRSLARFSIRFNGGISASPATSGGHSNRGPRTHVPVWAEEIRIEARVGTVGVFLKINMKTAAYAAFSIPLLALAANCSDAFAMHTGPAPRMPAPRLRSSEARFTNGP